LIAQIKRLDAVVLAHIADPAEHQSAAGKWRLGHHGTSCDNADVVRAGRKPTSFDHHVGAGEHSRGNGNAAPPASLINWRRSMRIFTALRAY